jgi:hypothetical protein
MRGYPVLSVPTEAPKPTSGEAVNHQVGPIFDASLSYLKLFSWQSTVGPLCGDVGISGNGHHQS